jgi:integrase
MARDWVFATGNSTHSASQRRALRSAADKAGLNEDGWPPLRFHDLRHAFASHPIIDLKWTQPESAGSSASPRIGAISGTRA